MTKLTLEKTAMQTLTLIGKLERYLYGASLKLVDGALHVTIPAYARFTEANHTVRAESDEWEFENIIEDLQSALKHFEEVENQRNLVAAAVKMLTNDQLKVFMANSHLLNAPLYQEMKSRNLKV